MDNKTLFTIIYAVVTVAAFLVGKYVFPKVPQDMKDKLNLLADWAAKFVIWAKEFLDKKTGAEKMAAVVEQLKRIADEAGIEVTEEQLKAIAQAAYEAMKAGEAEAIPAQLEAVTAQPAATVVINTTAEKVAIATDNVPDGALQENPDGTVNTYDADGNKTGTISAEEAKKAASNVGVIVAKEDNE
jgi:hypothetical protein